MARSTPRPATSPSTTLLAAQAAGVDNARGRLAASEASLRARLEAASTEARRASVELEEANGLFELAAQVGDQKEADAYGRRLPGLRAAAKAAAKELEAAKAASKGGGLAALRAALGRAEAEMVRLQGEEAAKQAAAQRAAERRAQEEAFASVLGASRAREVMRTPVRIAPAPAPAAAPRRPGPAEPPARRAPGQVGDRGEVAATLTPGHSG